MKGEVFFEKDFLYTSNVYKKSPYAQKNTAFFTSFFCTGMPCLMTGSVRNTFINLYAGAVCESQIFSAHMLNGIKKYVNK